MGGALLRLKPNWGATATSASLAPDLEGDAESLVVATAMAEVRPIDGLRVAEDKIHTAVGRPLVSFGQLRVQRLYSQPATICVEVAGENDGVTGSAVCGDQLQQVGSGCC